MTSKKIIRKRLAPKKDILMELYLYSGNQCAFDGCNTSLLFEDSTVDFNISHIYGVEEDGPRGKHKLNNEELREASNLLLLCNRHHRVIDLKKNESIYTVEAVRKMKEKHEKKYRNAIASLDRIVDISDGEKISYPTNLKALPGYNDDDNAEELATTLRCMRPWINAIAKQPLPIRDLLKMCLKHGHPKGYTEAKFIEVKFTQIEGVAQISSSDLAKRVLHLEDDDLLISYRDEGINYLRLNDPTSGEIGWDLFYDLYKLNINNPKAVKFAIIDLDFTVFDQ